MANGLLRLGSALMISCVLLSSAAMAAGPPASEIVDGVESDDKFAVGYLQGLLDSYEIVNYYLTNLNDANLLYCKPSGLVLTLGQTDDIVARYIEKHPMEGSFPAKGVILVALKDVFPCSGKP